MDFRKIALVSIALLLALPMAAPQTTSTPVAASAPTAVPSLVPYTGTAVASDGKILVEQANITFQIFKEETAGEPLWVETQSVQIDPTGHYKVQLGATSPNGLPADLFSTGEARWLEVQIAGQPPQPRVLLASVPYALKAGDATTLNGLPASAYVLAGGKSTSALASPAGVTPDGVTTVTTTGGVANTIPKFSGASTIVDSQIFDNGTNVGIGTTTPTAKFSVNGATKIDGTLTLPNLGTATDTTPYASQLLQLTASSFDSTTKAAVHQNFAWQAVPEGNDSPSPSGALYLLTSQGNAAPTASTGLILNSNGILQNSSPVVVGDLNLLLVFGQLEAGGGTGLDGIYAVGGFQFDSGGTTGLTGIDATGGSGVGVDPGGIGAVISGGMADLGNPEGGGGTGGEGLLVYAGQGATFGLAADFEGDVTVDGTLSASAKHFKIDHPLDPANKYLVHTSVESSEMMNIYSGNVTTDELGLATVNLPDWFEAENADFRYQLTTIGRDAHAWISQEVANKQFKISTNASNVKVSWQIAAVRQDPYAKAHPLVVEQDKGEKERGFYQHPELYGQPEEKQIQWGIHPDTMQKMAAEKLRMKQDRPNP